MDIFKQDIINFVFEQLSKQVKSCSLKEKHEIISKCVELLKQNKAGIYIIKIIRSVFKDNKLTISKIFDMKEEFLLIKQELIESFFTNFTFYLDLAHQ